MPPGITHQEDTIMDMNMRFDLVIEPDRNRIVVKNDRGMNRDCKTIDEAFACIRNTIDSHIRAVTYNGERLALLTSSDAEVSLADSPAPRGIPGDPRGWRADG